MNREKKNMLSKCVPKQVISAAITNQFISWDLAVKTAKSDMNSFGCVNATPVPKCAVKQEKGTTMDTRTEAQQAKDYLIDSLRGERRAKIDSEYAAFNLNGTGPKTFKELKDGLKKGFLVIPDSVAKNVDDDDHVYGIYDFLIWQDPSKKPDHKGFDAAKKLIEKDVSEVQDTIIVFGAEKGLEKLNEFKAKVYH